MAWPMTGGLALAVALASTSTPTPVYFEQTTVVSVDGRRQGEGVRSRVWFAGRKLRMQPGGAGPGPALVLRLDEGMAYRLDPDRKEAERLDLAELGERAREAAAAAGELMGAEEAVRTAALPGAKTVAGHACRGFRLTAGATAMEVYVASGLPLTAAAYADFVAWSGAREAIPGLLEAIEKLPGFPLETRTRVVVVGEVHETLATVTKVQVGAVPAALFEVPAGWRVR
jgi:hypothetical protein